LWIYPIEATLMLFHTLVGRRVCCDDGCWWGGVGFVLLRTLVRLAGLDESMKTCSKKHSQFTVKIYCYVTVRYDMQQASKVIDNTQLIGRTHSHVQQLQTVWLQTVWLQTHSTHAHTHTHTHRTMAWQWSTSSSLANNLSYSRITVSRSTYSNCKLR
jgi:hypothetical protein